MFIFKQKYSMSVLHGITFVLVIMEFFNSCAGMHKNINNNNLDKNNNDASNLAANNGNENQLNSFSNNIFNTNSATTFTNELATNHNNNIPTMNILDTQHNLATSYSDNSATNDNNMAINYNNDLATSYNDYMDLNYSKDLTTNYTDNLAINYNNGLATNYNENLATNMSILATEHTTNFNNNLATNYNDNLATNTNILATEPSSTTNYNNNLATEQHLATNNNANVNNLNPNDNNIWDTYNSATTNRNILITDNIGMPKNTLKRKRITRVHPTTIIQHVDIANFRKAVQEATGGPYKNSQVPPLYPMLPKLHASSGMPRFHSTPEPSTYNKMPKPLFASNIPPSFSLSGYPKPGPSLQEAFMMPMPQMASNSNNVLEGSSSKVTKPSLQQTFLMPMPQMASNSNDFLGEDSSSQYHGTLESLVWPKNPPNSQLNSEQHWDTSANPSNFKRARTSYFPTSELQEQMELNSNDFFGDFSSSQYHGTLESLVWPKNPPNSQLNMAPIMQSPPNLRDENLNVDTSISSSHSSNLNASDPLRSFNNIVPTNASADDHSIINLDSAHNHKLKAPIEAEIDDVSVGIKTLQDRLTKAAATSMDASVKQVRPVVDLSLFCLAILPSSIDKPLMQIRQGQSVPKTLLDTSILQKIKPHHVVKCLKKWLEEDHIKNSKIFKAKIGDIHTQIRRMFQKNPLIDEEPTNSEKQKDKQIENSDETRAVVLFFYFRLFRKLAGFLEAPFKGGINYNENAEKSEREALLLWIIIVGKQIVNEFVSSLQTDLSLKNAEQKIKMAQFLDSIDTVKESIDMVGWVITSTIAPIVGNKILNLNISNFVSILNQVQAQNVGCLILNCVSLNLSKIVKFASGEYLQFSLGAANNIQKIYNEAIQEEHDESQGQRRPNSIQNAKIYLKIYKTISNYLSPELRTRSSLDAVIDNFKKFLDQSTKELDKLISLWNMAKTHASSYEEQKKHATNKYIKEHCQNQKSITFY